MGFFFEVLLIMSDYEELMLKAEFAEYTAIQFKEKGDFLMFSFYSKAAAGFKEKAGKKTLEEL